MYSLNFFCCCCSVLICYVRALALCSTLTYSLLWYHVCSLLWCGICYFPSSTLPCSDLWSLVRYDLLSLSSAVNSAFALFYALFLLFPLLFYPILSSAILYVLLSAVMFSLCFALALRAALLFYDPCSLLCSVPSLCAVVSALLSEVMFLLRSCSSPCFAILFSRL